MDQFNGLAKILIVSGGIIVIIGILILLSGKIPFIGKLPGDFHYEGKNWSFYFPLATSILISIIVSLILYLIRKL
jgi:hypothetical protein